MLNSPLNATNNTQIAITNIRHFTRSNTIIMTHTAFLKKQAYGIHNDAL